MIDPGYNPIRFHHWLKMNRQSQEVVYEYDFDEMTLKEKAAYLFWNVFAAQQELAELAVEFSWKPWAVDEPFVNRERVIAEGVDVLHFLGNIFSGLKVTDSELNAAYEEKAQLNRKRMASGSYSAKKGGLGEGSDLG